MRAGRRYLSVNIEQEPNDPIVRCTPHAPRGRARKSAARDYLKVSLDNYALNFDRHLVEVLDCRLPDNLPPFHVKMGMTFTRILVPSLHSMDAPDVHIK